MRLLILFTLLLSARGPLMGWQTKRSMESLCQVITRIDIN